uniref:Peptidase metallopeptidase domain-containing protein n=1 Tax=Kalanchoe fedtschenkoi TaxID=63787 RepID=A0A7N0V174_KALFE
MAFRAIPVLLLLLCVRTEAASVDNSPFGFIRSMVGSHRGDRFAGNVLLTLLRNYLNEFGYTVSSDGDEFDESLEAAIKTYQNNFNLQPTGVLDIETVDQMVKPRCGVPDIINGTTRMASGNHKHSSFHTVSHYTFFPGMPRWPLSKTNLTYGFLSTTPTAARNPVSNAYARWAAATRFDFALVSDLRLADMTISFNRLSHGDGNPFDGRGGVLAHAFAPTDGRFHYDGDERWSVNPDSSAFHLETTALHEIGHLLGLGHSSVEAAIMFPSISPGAVKGLNADDTEGIRVLYS